MLGFLKLATKGRMEAEPVINMGPFFTAEQFINPLLVRAINDSNSTFPKHFDLNSFIALFVQNHILVFSEPTSAPFSVQDKATGTFTCLFVLSLFFHLTNASPQKAGLLVAENALLDKKIPVSLQDVRGFLP